MQAQIHSFGKIARTGATVGSVERQQLADLLKREPRDRHACHTLFPDNGTDPT